MDHRSPREKAKDLEDLTSWVRNPKSVKGPKAEPFKKVDQLLPKKAGQTPEERAKDLDLSLIHI